MIWYDMIWYDMIRYDMIWYDINTQPYSNMIMISRMYFPADNADMTRLLLYTFPFNRHGSIIGLYLCTFRSHHVAPHCNVVNELQLLPSLGRVGCYLGKKPMWHGWTWETRGPFAYTTRRNVTRCNNTAVHHITSHPIEMHATLVM